MRFSEVASFIATPLGAHLGGQRRSSCFFLWAVGPRGSMSAKRIHSSGGIIARIDKYNPAKPAPELAVASRDSNLKRENRVWGSTGKQKSARLTMAPPGAFFIALDRPRRKASKVCQAVVFKCRWLIYRRMLHGFVGRKARNFRTPTVLRARPLTPYCPTMGSSVPSLQVLRSLFPAFE